MSVVGTKARAPRTMSDGKIALIRQPALQARSCRQTTRPTQRWIRYVIFLGFIRSFSQRLKRWALSRSAFAITDTELRLIAAAAIIGLRSNPKRG